MNLTIRSHSPSMCPRRCQGVAEAEPPTRRLPSTRTFLQRRARVHAHATALKAPVSARPPPLGTHDGPGEHRGRRPLRGRRAPAAGREAVRRDEEHAQRGRQRQRPRAREGRRAGSRAQSSGPARRGPDHCEAQRGAARALPLDQHTLTHGALLNAAKRKAAALHAFMWLHEGFVDPSGLRPQGSESKGLGRETSMR